MLHPRVDKHKLVAVELEGEILELTRAAVEAHQIVLLAVAACELVHDAAVHAAIVVLRALTDTGQLHAVELIVVEQIVERKCKAALQSSRRRQAGTQRHIAGEHGVEALHLAAALDDLAAHAEHVARPLLLGSVLLVQTEFSRRVKVDRIQLHAVCAVGAYLGHDSLVNGAREYESTVVIGVLADEIETSRSHKESALSAEMLHKSLIDL